MTSKLAKDPAKYFIRRDVQELLIKVTGFDLSKIFKPDFNPELKNSEIQLLTQSQLELEQQKALEKAKQLIQMPPFLKPRERSDVVLDKDERLNPLNLKNTKYMFIDISLNIPDHVSVLSLKNIAEKLEILLKNYSYFFTNFIHSEANRSGERSQRCSPKSRL